MVALVLVATLLSIHLPLGESRMDGIENVENGCICHSATNSPEVKISFEGLPKEYQSNTTYNLVIAVEGGAVPIENPINTAGFNLWFHNGRLAPTSNDSQLTDNFQLTHTEFGNDQRTWNATWTSPADDSLSVEWRLTVNTVNGDGMAAPQDLWNQISGHVIGVNGTAPKPVSPLIVYGIPIALVTMAAIGYIMVTRSDSKALDSDEEE